jgi:hypothetical protein
VYFARLSKLSKAALMVLWRVANILKHALSGSAARRYWQLVGEKSALSQEMIKSIVNLSTLMAVLAILLLVSIVLGYI